MSDIILCPQCERKLRVPATLIGQAVKCPSCGATFTATLPDTPLPPEPEAAPPPGREREAMESYPEAAPPPGREQEAMGAYAKPRRYPVEDRGTLILVLGIVSLVTGIWPIGIAAWIMGNNDLNEIRAGRMNPAAEGSVQAGRICGMISTILMIVTVVVLCCGGLLFFVTVGAAASVG
ncbi:MAG: hypothetical protein ACK4RK_04225 [Gemmataceae bacterium]